MSLESESSGDDLGSLDDEIKAKESGGRGGLDKKGQKNDNVESDDEEDDDDDDEEDDESDLDINHEPPDAFNVSIRVRPLFSKEKTQGHKSILKVIENKYILLLNPAQRQKEFLVTKHDRSQQYAFDNVFSETNSSYQVYKNTARHIVPSILNGYNATVFAYGATGSGKTHTMLGDDKDPGVMIFTLRDLFKLAHQTSDKYQYRIVISFLEIYNENIRDLLVKDSKHLQLRESPKRGIIVAGITFQPANSTKEVMKLLQAGNKRRTTEATKANAVSSRSHAVLQIYVERRNKGSNDNDSNSNNKAQLQQIRCGKLNMIDLAGSERGSVTEARGKRLREGANINKSLLALANCINALVDGKKFVPYRDSKLTRLLKDALGGNARTVMIANLSPSDYTWEDTHNTLKYADRAKNIRVDAKVNLREQAMPTEMMPQVISSLKSEVERLKYQLQLRDKEMTKLMKNPSSGASTPRAHGLHNSQISHISILSNGKILPVYEEKSPAVVSEDEFALIKEVRDEMNDCYTKSQALFNEKKTLLAEANSLRTQALSIKEMIDRQNNSDLMNEEDGIDTMDDGILQMESEYQKLLGRIGKLQIKISEIQNDIDNNVEQAGAVAHKAAAQKSFAVRQLVSKEHELLVSKIDKMKAEVELQNYEKHYKEQANMLTQLQDKSTQQHMLILQKEKELKRAKSSISEIESKSQAISQETRKKVQQLEQELTKQKTENQLMLRQKLEKAKQEYSAELTRSTSALQEQIEQEREKVQLLQSQHRKRPERAKRELDSNLFRQWDAADVYYWLCDFDNGRLQEWAEMLYTQDITGDLLTELNGEDLTQMGIESLGARKAILRNINQLRRSTNQSMSVASIDTYDSRMDDSYYARDNDMTSEIIPFHDNLTPKHRKMLTSKSISMVEEYDPQLALMQKQILSNPDMIADPRFLQQFMNAYSSSQLSLGNIPKLSLAYGGSNNNLSVQAGSVSGGSGASGASMGALESLKEDKEMTEMSSPVTVTVVNLDENKSKDEFKNEKDSHHRDTSNNSDQSHTQSRSSEDNSRSGIPHIKSPSGNSNTNTAEDVMGDEEDLDEELTDIEKYETLKRDALKRLNQLRGEKSPRSKTRTNTDFDDGMLSDNEEDMNDLDRILRPVPVPDDNENENNNDNNNNNNNNKIKNDVDNDNSDESEEEGVKMKIDEKLKMMDEMMKSKFHHESGDEDSDNEMELDYEESWLEDDSTKSLNICLLSPYKRLRKAMIRFCFDDNDIDARTRTAAYKKYEKRNLKCGNQVFTFRMIEIYDPTYIGEMLENNLIHSVWIIYPFDITVDNGVPRKEEIFLEGLEDWLASTPHWKTFWQKSVRMLDHSLDFKHSKDLKIKSIDEYFTHQRARLQELKDLFVDFNIPEINNPQLKWLPIETNNKCKFKDKTVKPHKKFKWPNIPVTDGGLGQDWKVQLYLKLLHQLQEPYRSYFMAAAMATPKKNLVAKPFESEFKRTVDQGISVQERKETVPLAIHKKKKSKIHDRKHSKHGKHGKHSKKKSRKSNELEEDKYLNKHATGKELKSVFDDQPPLQESKEMDDEKDKSAKKEKKSKKKDKSSKKEKKEKRKEEDDDENNENNENNENTANKKQDKKEEKEDKKDDKKENGDLKADNGMVLPLKQSLSQEIDMDQVQSLLDDAISPSPYEEDHYDYENENKEKKKNERNERNEMNESNDMNDMNGMHVENEYDLDMDNDKLDIGDQNAPQLDMFMLDSQDNNDDSPTPPANDTRFDKLFDDINDDDEEVQIPVQLGNHTSNVVVNIHENMSNNMNANDVIASLSGSPRRDRPRYSQAIHDAQPSWAYSNVNAAISAYGLYGNYYAPFQQGINVYTPQLGAMQMNDNNNDNNNNKNSNNNNNNNSFEDEMNNDNYDSDDGLDEELDFSKQTSNFDIVDGTQAWKFNRKYAQQNRKQSIARMEDLIQGADKSIAALQQNQQPKPVFVSDDDTSNFKLDSDNFGNDRRPSKYNSYRDHKNTYLSAQANAHARSDNHVRNESVDRVGKAQFGGNEPKVEQTPKKRKSYLAKLFGK